jgi:hypothetical protein
MCASVWCSFGSHRGLLGLVWRKELPAWSSYLRCASTAVVLVAPAPLVSS